MICCLCTCRWQHHSGSNCQCHNQFYKQLQYWDWVSRRPDNGISVSRSVPTIVCPLVHAHPSVLPSSAEGIPEPPKTIILVVPWAATGVIFAFTALGVIFALVCSVLTCALWNRRYVCIGYWMRWRLGCDLSPEARSAEGNKSHPNQHRIQ